MALVEGMIEEGLGLLCEVLWESSWTRPHFFVFVSSLAWIFLFHVAYVKTARAALCLRILEAISSPQAKIALSSWAFGWSF